jgi:hypothetical protein
MLVHHSDTPSTGSSRGRDSLGCSADSNFTGIRARQAICDMHQRRFPRTILTEERVDFTGVQEKIDPAQRVHGAESFVYAQEIQ